jgi:class 3 adenylate cyclase
LVAIAAIAVAVLALVAVVLLARELRRTRRELAALRERYAATPRQGPLVTTGRVVRSVVERAVRLPDQGVTGFVSSSLEDLVRWLGEDRQTVVRVADADGQVCLFFSDIVDSTVLNERLGDDAWLRVLRRHDEIVAGAITGCGGQVVKTIGDGFMAAFGDAAAAVEAALRVHERMARSRPLRRTSVQVRIGLHRGRVTSRDGDYLGRNVALAARIAAAAAGGETLISETVVEAVDGRPGLHVDARGPAPLKGFDGTTPVFAVQRSAA